MVTEQSPYSKGTIKFTWIDPETYHVLHSRMFNSVDEALNYAQSKNFGNDFLLFELLESDGNKYAWKLLPYGRERQYVSGMKIKDNPILKYGSTTLMIVGALFIINYAYKKFK